MNNKYLYCIAILIFLASCGDTPTHIIEERLPVVEQSENAQKRLDENLQEVVDKSDDLISLQNTVKEKLAELESLQKEIAGLDLLADSQVVASNNSKSIYEFYRQANDILVQLADPHFSTFRSQIENILKASKIEEKKYGEDLDVTKKIDQINEAAQDAMDQQAEVEKLAAKVENQKKAIQEKIDEATQHIGAHFGDRKADLSSAVTQVQSATSVKEITDILKDPKFFNLETEIRNERNGAEAIVALENVQKILTGQEPGKYFLDNAKAQKKVIDDLFLAVPNSQDDVDKLGRTLDQILETATAKFGNYTKSKGIITTEQARKEAVKYVVKENPPQPPSNLGMPPPMLPAPPLVKIEQFEGKVDKVTSKIIGPAKTTIVNALKDLKLFYDPVKIKAVEDDIIRVSKPESYLPTYERLVEAVTPYTMEGIKAALESGDVLNTGDEAVLSSNIDTVIKNLEKVNVSPTVNRKRTDIVKERVEFLKKKFYEHPTIAAINAALNEMAKSIKVTEFLTNCNRISSLISLRMTAKPNCKVLDDELTDALQGAIGIGGMNAHNVAREKAVNEKIITPLEGPTAAKNQMEFKQAVDTINERLLTPEAKIDLTDVTLFPDDKKYTIKSIINEILDILNTVNFPSTKGKYVTYATTINAYADEIFPTMTAIDITNLGQKAVKSSGHLLSNIHYILSEDARKKILGPFTTPSDLQIIENMKQAAVGDNDNNGIRALKDAVRAVDEAIDNQEIADAINRLAGFFNSPKKEELEQAAALPGVYPDYVAQVVELRKMADSDSKYAALKAVSEIDPAGIDTLSIASLAVSADAIPKNMRAAVFGAKAGAIDVDKEFQNLKDKLRMSLDIMISAIPPDAKILTKDSATIDPIINAFNLVFLSILDEIDALVLDGSDDEAVLDVVSRFKAEPTKDYLDKFEKFKSIIGETDPATGLERPIITRLKDVLTKLNTATPTAQVDELKAYVERFLK